jgi:hypothetical protein
MATATSASTELTLVLFLSDPAWVALSPLTVASPAPAEIQSMLPPSAATWPGRVEAPPDLKDMMYLPVG